MATNHTIYLVNKSSVTQEFWCFLERPVELVNDPNVFANSSTRLAVRPNDPGLNTFTIPVQYSVGAGAGNNQASLGIQIKSTITLPADLDDKFLAEYATVPPNVGPTLTKTGTGTGSRQISIETNAFDRVKNEGQSWFSNQSFGIQTDQGYLGMTWSPDPSQRRVLTPTLKFYVAVGKFGQNQLASWTQVSVNSAELVVPTSFSNTNEATVTYLSDGTWKTAPGKPQN